MNRVVTAQNGLKFTLVDTTLIAKHTPVYRDGEMLTDIGYGCFHTF